MGLFGNNNKKIAKKIMENAAKSAVRKTLICPQCRTRVTVTFLGPNDSYTCKKCGYRIYANEV